MNPNDPKYSVVLNYEDIEDGTTHQSEICPACEGGTSKEKSFSVSRLNQFLLYNCHRASCGFKGRVHAPTNGITGRPAEHPEKSRVTISSAPLNTATLGFLSTKYGISRDTLEAADLGWTGEGDSRYSRRISFPIFGPDSKKRGVSYRSYEGAKPKALIELQPDRGPALAWYKFLRVSDSLVIVEDQVSALKLAPHTHAVALLGTHISDAKMEELKEGKYKRIYLSLDPDATFTAIKLQLKWVKDLPNMMIAGLGSDIKDMNDEDFKYYLNRIKETT